MRLAGRKVGPYLRALLLWLAFSSPWLVFAEARSNFVGTASIMWLPAVTFLAFELAVRRRVARELFMGAAFIYIFAASLNMWALYQPFLVANDAGWSILLPLMGTPWILLIGFILLWIITNWHTKRKES